MGLGFRVVGGGFGEVRERSALRFHDSPKGIANPRSDHS